MATQRPEGHDRLKELLVWDERTRLYRTAAHNYRELVLYLTHHKLEFVDNARQFERVALPLQHPLKPFPHQAEGLKAWVDAGCTGIVELPTGAGKTILAVMAIARVGRPTLIVVPTIDLMLQW
ncbi:MAG: DEAD/DEAH box helicase family protein, partial [Nannocystaceae bacterium]